jgi:hypothetical protein
MVREVTIISSLGFAKLYESGILENKTYYIVMNKLGKTLKDIMTTSKKKFSLMTVCLIGI